MKIVKVKIQGIQSIKAPVEVNFSKALTQIKGSNAAGKSTVVKALKLFAGTYTNKDVKSLITRDMPVGARSYVEITLEDGNRILANVKPTGAVDYYYYDEKGTVLNHWNQYSREIADILKWRFIENANMCLNFKPFNENIFIDTKPDENAEIMNYLCNEPEVEIKIANIIEYQSKISDLTNKVNRELKHVDGWINRSSALPYGQIKTKDEELTQTYNTITFIGMLKEYIGLMEAKLLREDLMKIQKMLTLKIIYNTSKEIIQAKKRASTINSLSKKICVYRVIHDVEDIRSSKQTLLETKKLKAQQKDLQNSLLRYEILKNSHKYIETSTTVGSVNELVSSGYKLRDITGINNIIKSSKEAKELRKNKALNILLNKTFRTINANKMLANTISEKASILKNRNNLFQMSSLEFLSGVNLLNILVNRILQQKVLKVKINQLNSVKEISQLVELLNKQIEGVNKTRKELEDLQEKVKEFSICPFCNQPIKEEHVC